MSSSQVEPVTAAEHIEALMQIHPKGFDLSLDRIKGLLARLGNPQDRLPPVIHFAGTNGKGSAIAFTRAILESAGLSVHVHTSPHLVNWHERYRIGAADGPGQLVSDPMLAAAISKVAEANRGEPITVFEVLTAVTFVLFSEQPADVCLIEVGLGGRFDATNVMAQTCVSVITPVSIDHEAYLGDTLAKIAFEKAGIIKHRSDLVVGPQQDEALEVIERQAARMGAKSQIASQHFSTMKENGRLLFQDENALIDLPVPKLPGDHQLENAGTAIAAARIFAQKTNLELTNSMIEKGVLSAQWPGRMQHLPKGKIAGWAPQNSDVWLDGGHNPGAAQMIANFMAGLNAQDSRPLYLICGMLNTKDPKGYFEQFTSLAKGVLTVPILSSDAGIPAAELADHVRETGLFSEPKESLQEALSSIEQLNSAQAEVRILICGSLYLVGDALELNNTPPT